MGQQRQRQDDPQQLLLQAPFLRRERKRAVSDFWGHGGRGSAKGQTCIQAYQAYVVQQHRNRRWCTVVTDSPFCESTSLLCAAIARSMHSMSSARYNVINYPRQCNKMRKYALV